MLLVLACGVSSEDGFESLEMEKEELLGLFELFEALLDDKDWAQDHPQPCSETPWPGVQCEIGQETATPLYHVTKIHVGPDVDPPCKASATLSRSLLKLPYLKTLSIFNCFSTPKSTLTLSPSLFGSLSSLEHLSLVSNPSLSGEIPATLSNLTGLKILSLSQNSLVGNIPREIGGMASLEQLDLSYNNLTGQIPGEIGRVEKLTILDLSRNSLDGQIPSSLGLLDSLQKVDFGSNKLVGTIPPEIGNLGTLVLLDLSNNLLNGPIPDTLSGLERLEHFIADHNPLNSRVPEFLGLLKKLQTLSLSRCGLKGTIPGSLSSLKHLSSLSLHTNGLTGTVPPSLGTIRTLDLLNLSNNRLTGELLLRPDFIDRLGKRLDIRGNDGLCTANRNVSVDFEAPVCLSVNASGGEPRRSDEPLAWPHPRSVSRGTSLKAYYPFLFSLLLPSLGSLLV